MGLGANELRGLLGREPARELVLPTIAADDLTAYQSTITTSEIVRGPEITQVGDDATPGRPARFTTRSLLDLAREALEIGLDGREAGAPRAGIAHVMSAVADAPVRLSEEQRTLVATAALSSNRLVCVVGVAGAGTTTALRALGDALSARVSRCSGRRRAAGPRMSFARQPRSRREPSTPSSGRRVAHFGMPGTDSTSDVPPREE